MVILTVAGGGLALQGQLDTLREGPLSYRDEERLVLSAAPRDVYLFSLVGFVAMPLTVLDSSGFASACAGQKDSRIG